MGYNKGIILNRPNRIYRYNLSEITTLSFLTGYASNRFSSTSSKKDITLFDVQVVKNVLDTRSTGNAMTTILIVDDDFACQRLSSFVLQDRHTVITASNGRQALECLGGAEVDLVITDLSMPVMSGIELLKHIRQHKSSDILPIIVLSGNIHENNRGRICDAGANAVLTKPTSPDDLVILVQQLLEQRTLAGRSKHECASFTKSP